MGYLQFQFKSIFIFFSGFIKYVVMMLFELWDQYHQTDLSCELVKNLRINLEHWEDIYHKEEGFPSSDDSSTNNDEEDAKMADSSPDYDISAAMNKGRRYTLPLILPQYLPITRVRRESVGGDCDTVQEDVSDSPDKQSLQHQPASFPPYYRLSPKMTISPSERLHRSCKVEAAEELQNNQNHSSDTSSAGGSDKLCSSSSPPPVVQSTDGGSNPRQGEHEWQDNNNQSGTQRCLSEADDEQLLENYDCTLDISSPDNGFRKECVLALPSSRPCHNFLRRGSEPSDLKKLRLFEIPYLEVHPSLRNANSVKVKHAARRGSMPTTLIGLFLHFYAVSNMYVAYSYFFILC